MPDGDLIAMRMRLTGGKQVAGETKLVRDEMGRLRDEQGRYVKDQVQGQKTQEQSTKKTSAAYKKQAAMMASTGRAMTYGITLPLGLVGVAAVKTAADFTRSMSQVGIATKTSGRELDSMKQLALDMGAKTIFSANDSAEAMLALAKAGISPTTIKAGALSAAMNLAATESMDLGRSAEITAAAMNTFGLKGGEAGVIADALAGGANASSASVEGLAMSLAQGGQSAAMYGLSVQETVGALAAFAQNGIQASDAGTSLKTFLMRLNPTTKKAREEMNRLGLDFFDSSGHMKDMRGISEELGTTMRGMSDEQRGAAMNVIFGSDAIRAANILYKEGSDGVGRYVKATERRGAAEEMANAQMQGLPGALERAKGSLETAALRIGEGLAPAIITVASGVEWLANSFGDLPPELQTTITSVGALVALAGPVLWFAGSMAKAVIAIRALRAAEASGGGGMLSGSRKGMLARLGVGVGGTLAAQGAGDAIGGDLGNWTSMAGTGAATGFMVGGPAGALVGGAAGGVAAAVGKISDEMHQLSWEQRRLVGSAKDVANTWRDQRVASRGLVAADDRVRTATKRRRTATTEMRQAQRHLNAVVSEYGSKSRPAIHAEARLTGLVHKHRRAIKQLQNAERLRGAALSAYKTATNITVLAERHRINVLSSLRDKQARLFAASKQAAPQSEKTRELASKLLGTEGKLADATKRHGETLADAASKGGASYAKFLQRGTQEALRFGGQLKAMKLKTDALSESLQRLSHAPVAPSGPSTPGPVGPRGGVGPGPSHKNTSHRPSPQTHRLLMLGSDFGPPAARPDGASGGGSNPRYLVATPIKLGRKVIAEAVVEAEEDAKARL